MPHVHQRCPSVPVLWAEFQPQSTAITELIQIWEKMVHQDSVTNGLDFVGSKSRSQWPHISWSDKCNISKSPPGSPSTSGTNAHLDSGTDWLDFDGQWSQVMVTVSSQNVVLALWTQHLHNNMRGFCQICYRHSFKDKQITVWLSKVKASVTT